MRNVKELREAAGLSQTALALRVGVSRQAVAAWESGAWPNAELIPRIAFALGCEIRDLYGNEEGNEGKILRCAQDDGPSGTPAPTE